MVLNPRGVNGFKLRNYTVTRIHEGLKKGQIYYCFIRYAIQ